MRIGGRASQLRHAATRTLSMSTATLLWGVLFSAIGLGFLLYGKRQRVIVPLACGLALMIFPYFISNSALLVAIGIVLIVIPYFIRF